MRSLLIRHHKLLLLGLTLVPIVGYGVLSALALTQPNPETDEVSAAETATDEGSHRWEVVVDDYRSQKGDDSDSGKNTKKPTAKSAADKPDTAAAADQNSEPSADEATTKSQPVKTGDHTIVIAPNKSVPYTVKFRKSRTSTPKDQAKEASR